MPPRRLHFAGLCLDGGCCFLSPRRLHLGGRGCFFLSPRRLRFAGLCLDEGCFFLSPWHLHLGGPGPDEGASSCRRGIFGSGVSFSTRVASSCRCGVFISRVSASTVVASSCRRGVFISRASASGVLLLVAAASLSCGRRSLGAFPRVRREKALNCADGVGSPGLIRGLAERDVVEVGRGRPVRLCTKPESRVESRGVATRRKGASWCNQKGIGDPAWSVLSRADGAGPSGLARGPVERRR